MRASLLALLLFAACTPMQPAYDPTLPADDVTLEELRLENERLRRLLAAEEGVCPDPGEAYRGRTVEVLLTDVFFESGSADLTTRGQERLDAVADRIRREMADQHLRIEGHTDNQAIGPSLRTTFPTNWELSTARAVAVLRYLVETHGLDPARLEAVGMGPHDPVDTNATDAGRARNRRVRIAVLPE